ncbi:hypothetical protein HMPREF1212_01618 [Parabacteroides sp. HGS0025]|uniref:helix-turn-helix domain-containing protein n=1 Tax=Parabacteroides sp. HGS0025 TaxID=1078087 RepID=UPI0006177C5C|nr:helix-turn-helix domain-containing protein [Parabacteroides sp. HGS0025]KKB50891.1 hypothetical protein HMPREF1212_01618 [Parabacteroides sp. HGS0025]
MFTFEIPKQAVKQIMKVYNNPEINISEDWFMGYLTPENMKLLNPHIKSLCWLKMEMFILCLKGEAEIFIDLNHYLIKPGSFITILPETVLQIQAIKEDIQIYILAFSSDFINKNHINNIHLFNTIKKAPVIELKRQSEQFMKDYFLFLTKTYNSSITKLNDKILIYLFKGIWFGVESLYNTTIIYPTRYSRNEQISINFHRLVLLHYTEQRNVAWYADQLGITQAHLSTVIKQTTGKTCIETITSMVIMKAQIQLKSTNLAIQDIAKSLNFNNMSFFGKYFKRNVGIGPLKYRIN